MENNFEILNNIPKSFKLAKKICVDTHYSRTCPPSKYYFFVKEKGELIGVITFGVGANRNALLQFRNKELNWNNALELTRCAFYKHQNYLSFYIAKILKKLKEYGYVLIFSYCDVGWQNHDGALYKSCNFKAFGHRNLSGFEVYENGRWRHQRNYWKPYLDAKKENPNLKFREYLSSRKLEVRRQGRKVVWVYQLRKGVIT